MLMRKLLMAELAIVQISAEMYISVHPHIVAGGVVLPTFHADVSLLPPWADRSEHVTFLELRAVRRGVDAVQGQNVVRVGVGNVFTPIFCLNNSVGSWIRTA